MTSSSELVAGKGETIGLRGLSIQLKRMMEGAAFVKDGIVRVRDPQYLVDKLDAAADCIEALQRELAAEREAKHEAVLLTSEWAQKAGEAEGKLKASEMAGVVDGWKERAEAAERELAQAREDRDSHQRVAIAAETKASSVRREALEALEPFAKIADALEFMGAGNDPKDEIELTGEQLLPLLIKARAAIRSLGENDGK